MVLRKTGKGLKKTLMGIFVGVLTLGSSHLAAQPFTYSTDIPVTQSHGHDFYSSLGDSAVRPRSEKTPLSDSSAQCEESKSSSRAALPRPCRSQPPSLKAQPTMTERSKSQSKPGGQYPEAGLSFQIPKAGLLPSATCWILRKLAVSLETVLFCPSPFLVDGFSHLDCGNLSFREAQISTYA